DSISVDMGNLRECCCRRPHCPPSRDEEQAKCPMRRPHQPYFLTRASPPALKDAATTRSVTASTHRIKRFSLAHPPNLAPTPHAERPATTGRPFCPSPPASPYHAC